MVLGVLFLLPVKISFDQLPALGALNPLLPFFAAFALVLVVDEVGVAEYLGAGGADEAGAFESLGAGGADEITSLAP